MYMIGHQHIGMNGNLVTHGTGNGCFQIELVVGLKQSGQLEVIIRRRLSSIYTSTAALNYLQTTAD